jgi:alpha-D-xyloside xylohydrolase
MALFSKDGNALLYRYDAEKVRIEPWGKNSLRFRASKMAELPAEDWALLSPEPSTPEITIGGEGASIRNGKIELRITGAGKVTVYNQRNEKLLEEFIRNRRDVTTDYCSALDIENREFKPIIGGDYEITLRLESVSENERIYGMGQYQQPYFNLKGCILELAQRNSQASVPFMISSIGYGFLWNNPAVGRVTFGKNLTVWEVRSSKKLDYWITAGDTPSEIEEAYARAVGTVPMMPDFALGFWQSRLRYRTQEELLTVAREYKKRGLPISVIVADFFHWPFQGEWKFDPVYWPDPDSMIRELKEMGIELMVSIWPTVDRRSENWEEMLERGLLVRTERGYRISMDFEGNTIHYDATNPEARSYLWEKVKKNYHDKGIRIFWLDEAEPEYTGYDFDHYRYHLGPDLQIGNLYPMMYAKNFFDGMSAAGQKNIINLLRCAWAGSQRYGALVWSGDIHSSFASLRNQLVVGLNMGIAGIPWWTTDIGGFHGGHIGDPYFHELLIRWFQWGCFCPVMRIHGNREPTKPQYGTTGGASCRSGADNEVWSYTEEVYEICKKYLFLREKLKPYIETLMRAAHEKGTPVIRPLFYEFPGDDEAWKIEDQYFFGPDYLVAPVCYEGRREREVYLPARAKWTNAWSGETFEGGRIVTVAAPLDTIPVFCRDGVKMPG